MQKRMSLVYDPQVKLSLYEVIEWNDENKVPYFMMSDKIPSFM